MADPHGWADTPQARMYDAHTIRISYVMSCGAQFYVAVSYNTAPKLRVIKKKHIQQQALHY